MKIARSENLTVSVILLLTYISVLGFPAVVAANGVHNGGNASDGEVEFEIELFRAGDSKSNVGNAQFGSSGVRIETEYEKNNKVFSFNYERWNYSWNNTASLPFAPGIVGDPWNTFTTLQFGFDYEQEISKRWEFNYYLEAESSFEKERSNSGEYEAGIDFTFDLSKHWSFTLNTNYEYLDAEEGEFGVDLEIAWNDHAKEGWSGEFEISSEFPESVLRYHFTRAFSTAVFYGEGGTNTIRLSDSSPVPGMQGGYFEDEYRTYGMRFDYEWVPEGYLSFSLQQNTERRLTFTDKTGAVERSYAFGDSVEISIKYSQEF